MHSVGRRGLPLRPSPSASQARVSAIPSPLNVDKVPAFWRETSIIPVIVSTSLAVNAELKARLPAGTRLISKNLISRESVALFLREATSQRGM
jgi:hypothetical protein